MTDKTSRRTSDDDEYDEKYGDKIGRRTSKDEKYERTNQLITGTADDEGLATPQAPTRDAETPSREQLLRGVMNPDLIDDRPTPEEWREEHDVLDEDDEHDGRDKRHERDKRDDDDVAHDHRDEGITERIKHKFKGE
jgi:hypothetical protein